MGLPELLAILLVVAVCGLLMVGYPVAFTLGGTALAFAAIGNALGVMPFSLLGALPPRVDKVKGMENFLGDFLAFFSTAGS